MRVGGGTKGTRLAVILAAGVGMRLGEEGKLAPKGLLRMGEEFFLQRSIRLLRNNGIQRIVVVVGHLEERLMEVLDLFPDVETVPNPIFADSGSLYSLCCARPRVDEDFLLLESDIVYEEKPLSRLIGMEGSGILVSPPTGSGDEVWVSAEAGRVTGLSKDPGLLEGTIAGEFVGITRIAEEDFGILCHRAETTLLNQTPHFEYETQGFHQAAGEIFFRLISEETLVWAEVDTPHDLVWAQREVFPRILAADSAKEASTWTPRPHPFST